MKIKHATLLILALLVSTIVVLVLKRTPATHASSPQPPAVQPPAVQAPAAQPPAAHTHTPPAKPQPPRPFIDSLITNFRVEPCCASTLSRCAEQKPDCAIARRLINFTLWLDGTGKVTDDKISEMLQARYATFTDAKRHNADIKGWPLIGDPNAPLTVVVYFSGTCPMCKNHFRSLYPMITTGPLRGKVNMVAKPFGTGVANRALTAAHDMGRFADFMLELGKAGGRIDENVIYSITDAMYMNRDKFKAAVESPDLMKRVETSTSEADKFGVTHIPTYFMAGRRYNSIMDPHWIVEFMEYVQETAMQ